MCAVWCLQKYIETKAPATESIRTPDAAHGRTPLHYAAMFGTSLSSPHYHSSATHDHDAARAFYTCDGLDWMRINLLAPVCVCACVCACACVRVCAGRLSSIRALLPHAPLDALDASVRTSHSSSSPHYNAPCHVAP